MITGEKKKKYEYEVHFPNAKETFTSDKNMTDFFYQLTHGGAVNTTGKLIVINKSMMTFIAQSDTNLKF